MIPDLFAEQPLYALLLVPVAAALLGRVPIVGGLLRLAAWVVLLFFAYTLLVQRGQIDPALGRLVEYFDVDRQEVSGSETRVRMSPDGHFWVKARIGAVERRMLVDSGATVTALSPKTLHAADLKAEDGPVPVILTTANGMVRAQTAKVPELRLGNIVARDLAIVSAPGFGDTDVLGMNFLSRLQSWRVEERTLILVPHHPQGG